MRRYHWHNGEEATLTDAQRKKLDQIAERFDLTDTVHLSPGFGGEYVLVDVGSMIIGVEQDGYAHT